MKLKLKDYVAAYRVSDCTVERIGKVGQRHVGIIDGFGGKDLVIVNGIYFHIKSVRKIKKIPKIFRDYKVGDKVHVFDCQGIYQGAGEVSSTSKSEAGNVEVIVKGVIGWDRQPLQPVNLRKVKE